MKRTKNFLGLIAISTLMFSAACSNDPKGDQAKVGEQQEAQAGTGAALRIDTSATAVVFKGNGVGKYHKGIFKVSNGDLNVQDGKVTGGKFTININSMLMEEKEDFITGKLRPHLLSPDFFDADKYPASQFEITKVEPYTPAGNDTSVVAGANYIISGNLTLKDVTKNISFPAKIDVANNLLTAAANFNIDRTWWGMAYGNDQSLKDKFISPVVNIELAVKAAN
jgi:polyisoprenoid-binding protein YceI